MMDLTKPVTQTLPRKKGFAAMDPQRQRELAALGGRTAHQEGHAHTWNTQTAKEAAAKSVQVRRAKRSARVQAMSRPSVPQEGGK